MWNDKDAFDTELSMSAFWRELGLYLFHPFKGCTPAIIDKYSVINQAHLCTCWTRTSNPNTLYLKSLDSQCHLCLPWSQQVSNLYIWASDLPLRTGRSCSLIGAKVLARDLFLLQHARARDSAPRLRKRSKIERGLNSNSSLRSSVWLCSLFYSRFSV